VKASISADFNCKFPTLVIREHKMPNREIFIGNKEFKVNDPVIAHLLWNSGVRSSSTLRNAREAGLG